MLKKIKVEKFYRNDKKKDGTPYKDKNGKPFSMCTIITTGKEGEVRMSCLDYGDSIHFEEGQMAMLDVARNGEYINFRIPSEAQIEVLELRTSVDDLKTRVEALEAQKAPTKASDDPTDYDLDDPERVADIF